MFRLQVKRYNLSHLVRMQQPALPTFVRISYHTTTVDDPTFVSCSPLCIYALREFSAATYKRLYRAHIYIYVVFMYVWYTSVVYVLRSFLALISSRALLHALAY